MIYTEEELRMQLLAGIITEGMFQDAMSKLKSGVHKVVLGAALSVALSLGSCSKEHPKYIYQYSYQTENQLIYNKANHIDTRTTSMYPVDHRLSSSEEESLKQELDAQAPINNDAKVPGTSKLVLYAIDTQGEWR